MQLPDPEMNLEASSSSGPASPPSPGATGKSTTMTMTTTTTRDSSKPVKVLPCPRCESMNTKFCYYNNYSVTQPRHFCRQCQRYWTAGGTLRNVPVGGGSRKKNRHIHREPYSSQQQQQQQQQQQRSSQQPGPSAGIGMQSNVGLQPMAFNFAGYGHQYAPNYGLEHLAQLGSHHHPGMYASQKPDTESLPSSLHHHAMFAKSPGSLGSLGSEYYLHDAVAAPTRFPIDTTTAVKPEFWPPMAAPNASKLNGRYEAPMLLNLGVHNNNVNNRTNPKGSSAALQGSSIEEEGSTPSNGFSKSGYEEGDAVSSMWHNLHDMDNLHLSVKW